MSDNTIVLSYCIYTVICVYTKQPIGEKNLQLIHDRDSCEVADLSVEIWMIA